MRSHAVLALAAAACLCFNHGTPELLDKPRVITQARPATIGRGCGLDGQALP